MEELVMVLMGGRIWKKYFAQILQMELLMI